MPAPYNTRRHFFRNHCRRSYKAPRQASSVDHDYLKHGFVAGSKEQEIACSDYEVLLDACRRHCGVSSNLLVAHSSISAVAFIGIDIPPQVWITRSCVDVTCQLSDALAEVDALSRANLLRVRRQDIARQAEEAVAATDGGCRCEVQEMWADKSYVRITTAPAPLQPPKQ